MVAMSLTQAGLSYEVLVSFRNSKNVFLSLTIGLLSIEIWGLPIYAII